MAGCSFQVDYSGPVEAADSAPTATADARSDAVAARCSATGERITPLSAAHHLPDLGEVCTPANSLAADGAVAGLDRPSNNTSIELVPGERVSACIELDFGQVETWASIRIRATAVDQACSTPCQDTGCGESGYIRVFSAAEPGSDYAVVDVYTDLTPSRDVLTDWDLFPTEPAREIIICRGGGGASKDDIIIDAVSAVCP